MTREDVVEKLSGVRPELKDLGVEALYLFGSVARGEGVEGSDVDLLVEFSEPVGLIHFVRVQQRLEEILGVPVDLVTKPALKRPLRDRILREAIRAA